MEKKKKNTCLSLTYPHVHIHPLYTHPYIKKKKKPRNMQEYDVVTGNYQSP